MTNEQKGGEAGGITAEQRSRRDMQKLYDVHSYEVRRYGVVWKGAVGPQGAGDAS